MTVSNMFVYDPPRGMPDVLFEDEGFIIVRKPAGLLSVPGRKPEHQDSLITSLKTRYDTAQIVHRLDMDTSGVMVVALNADTHRHFSAQFERRLVKKRYQALLSGVLTKTHDPQGVVNAPLICDWPNRPRQMVDFDLGKKAQTRYKVADCSKTKTRVYLYPVTGRSHQLRVHMQYIGYPIAGDRFYNDDAAQDSRMMLHADRLSVLRPDRDMPSGLPDETAYLTFEDACPF